jgi:hypothetical protein
MWKTRADALEGSVDVGVVTDTGILSQMAMSGECVPWSRKELTTIPNDRICVRSPHRFLFFLEGDLIWSLASRDALHVGRNGGRLGRPPAATSGFANIGADPKRVVP